MIIPSRRRRESVWTRLLSWSFRRGRRVTSYDLQSLLDEKAFQFQIEKERCRAERRGIEFSLIYFESPQQVLSVEQLEQLNQLFRDELRITDDVGLINNCLSVLLPDTPADGAVKVATTLTEIASNNQITLVPRISCYPDDNKDQHDKDQHDDHSNGALIDRDQQTYPSTFGRSQLETARSIRPESLQFSMPVSIWKRLFDVVVSSFALAVFSPVMLVAAILIKLTSKGPVLFVQLREGKDGVPFRIYKFRTMILDAESWKENLMNQNEQDGPAFKIKDDPRLTKIGKWLRKSCVDELPQLMNVLKGEMSMVGPRPLPVNESQQCTLWQRRRLEVLPGMTGIWQAAGVRDIPFDDWMRMDLEYLKKQDIGFDIKLLVKTAKIAVLQRGSV